jgi:two-component system OmpR family response regulator
MNPTTDHVLLVDDDPEIRQLTAQYLEQNGLQCSTAASGREMRQLLQSQRVDLLVLDVMMPGEDGLTICRDLRAQGGAHSALPILMLTARTDDTDRILGLEMGADDYLGKPFVPRELLARIRAILRRARALPANLQSTHSPNIWRFSGYSLDGVSRQVRNPDGVLLVLTSGEYRLLHVLLQHANKVLSRDQLLELTQGRAADAFDRSIDLLISRLRVRLGEPARSLGLIKTVRSEGYVLATEVLTE